MRLLPRLSFRRPAPAVLSPAARTQVINDISDRQCQATLAFLGSRVHIEDAREELLSRIGATGPRLDYALKAGIESMSFPTPAGGVR